MRATAPKVPALRQHARGYWFCRWAGRNRYFCRVADDPDGAQSMPDYLATLEDWRTWRQEKMQTRRIGRKASPLLVDLAADFMRAKQLERGLPCRQYYAKHLNRALWMFGRYPSDMFRASHLHALKEHMLQRRLAPKTINHDLVAVRALFNWACGLELVPSVNLRGVHTMPLGPPPDKSATVAKVRRMIRNTVEPVRSWLAVNYLAALRPSEVIRIAAKQGKWIKPGVFVLDKGKMDARSHWPRHCIFSDEALQWVPLLQPVWTRLDSYSQAVREVLGNGSGPGRLRHSAASHLALAGVSDADIEMILGHVPPRLRVTYHQPNWRHLRVEAARLTLKFDP
jgi:integrase